MVAEILVYNPEGELILDSSRKILTAYGTATTKTFRGDNWIDHSSYYYDASSAAAQPIKDGGGLTVSNVFTSMDSAYWLSCNSGLNFITYPTKVVVVYPATSGNVTCKIAATNIPDVAAPDDSYAVVYNQAGERCWSVSSLLKGVIVLGYIRIDNTMVFNKSPTYLDIPSWVDMNNVYVPFYNGINREEYVDEGGVNYLLGVIYKYVGQRVYAKLFNNTQTDRGYGSSDIPWTGGVRLLPVVYIPPI